MPTESATVEDVRARLRRAGLKVPAVMLATAVTFGGITLTMPTAAAAAPVQTAGQDDPDDHRNVIRRLLGRVTNPVTRAILKRYLDADSRNPLGTCFSRCLAQKWVEAGMPTPSLTNEAFYKMVIDCSAECVDVGKAKRLAQKWLRERRQKALDEAEQKARDDVKDLKKEAKDSTLTPEQRNAAEARLPDAHWQARQAVEAAGRHRNLSSHADGLDALADNATSDARDLLRAEADAARKEAREVAADAKTRRKGPDGGDDDGDARGDRPGKGDDGGDDGRSGGPRKGGDGGPSKGDDGRSGGSRKGGDSGPGKGDDGRSGGSRKGGDSGPGKGDDGRSGGPRKGGDSGPGKGDDGRSGGSRKDGGPDKGGVGPRRGGGRDGSGGTRKAVDGGSGTTKVKTPTGKRGDRGGSDGKVRTADTVDVGGSTDTGVRGGTDTGSRGYVRGGGSRFGIGGNGGRGRGGRGGGLFDVLLGGGDPFAGMRQEADQMAADASTGAKSLRDYLAAHPKEAVDLVPLVKQGEVPWQDPGALDSFLADWDGDHDDRTGRARPRSQCEIVRELGGDCAPEPVAAAPAKPGKEKPVGVRREESMEALRDDKKAVSATTSPASEEEPVAVRREESMEALRDDKKAVSATTSPVSEEEPVAVRREESMEALRDDKKAVSATKSPAVTSSPKKKPGKEKPVAVRREEAMEALRDDKKAVSTPKTKSASPKPVKPATKAEPKTKSVAEKREEAMEAMRDDKKAVSEKPETKSQKNSRVKAEAA